MLWYIRRSSNRQASPLFKGQTSLVFEGQTSLVFEGVRRFGYRPYKNQTGLEGVRHRPACSNGVRQFGFHLIHN